MIPQLSKEEARQIMIKLSKPGTPEANGFYLFKSEIEELMKKVFKK